MGVDDKTKTSDDCKTSFVGQVLEAHGTQVSPRVHEIYACRICAKHFANNKILQLHLQIHQANDKIVNSKNETTSNQRISGANEEPPIIPYLTEFKPKNKTNSTSSEQLLFQCSAAAKKVGLTKIRLEDCFRCDACSCIYLEEEDYRKHMRNFHKDPLLKQKQKKVCKSCCKQCKCKGDHTHLTEPTKTTHSNNLHFNIKDRWRKMVLTRMSCGPTKTPVTIKTEPDLEDCNDTLDYSHLLSQVEVRIKTEPEDDTELKL